MELGFRFGILLTFMGAETIEDLLVYYVLHLLWMMVFGFNDC